MTSIIHYPNEDRTFLAGNTIHNRLAFGYYTRCHSKNTVFMVKYCQIITDRRCGKMYEALELIITIAFVVVAGIAIYQAIKKKKK